MYASGPLGKIVLIDDDENIVDLLRFNLNAEGFVVETFPHAKDVSVDQYIDARLIIVDAMNQPYTGIDFTRDLKSNPETADIPVIICSGDGAEDSIIDAFDAGADDFINKPFSLRELVARSRAVLRRHPLRQSQRISQSRNLSPSVIDIPNLNLHIDTAKQQVVEDGIVVPLTKTEYAILSFLIKNQNSFFNRNEISMEVWKDDPSSNSRVVDTNISRLRKKLGESGKYIINRYGMGYAFVDKLQ